MDENLRFYALVFVVSLLLSGFFSASETALVSLGKIRVRQIKERHRRLGAIVERLTQSPERILSAVLLGNNIVNTAATAAGTAIAIVLVPAHPVLAATAVVTVILLLFAEITPKSIAARRPDLVSLFVAQPLSLFAALASPLVRILALVPRIILRLFGGESAPASPTSEDLKTLAILGREEGVLSEAEKEMIHSIVEYSDLPVDQIMVPRVHIKGVDLAAPIEEILDLVVTTEHARIPVYRESLDDIAGILRARDLLLAWREEREVRIEGLLQPAYFVSEHHRVRDLLKEFRARKLKMAVVVDEYGGTAGLVTLNDILAELVGAFVDEYDLHLKEIQRAADGTLVVSGRLEIEDLNRAAGFSFPEGDLKTVSGLLVNHLGRVPGVGEDVTFGGAVFHVIGADRRRIHSLSVRRAGEGASPAG